MQTISNQTRDTAKAKSYFENKIAFTTGPVELYHLRKEGERLTIVDVREAVDFAKGHVPGAINLPKNEWENPRGLSKDNPNVVYCYTQQCHLAARGCAEFAAKGFPVMEMEGGFEAWKASELEVEGERGQEQRFRRAA